MSTKFDYLDHTADIGIRVYGQGLGEIFINAALALREILVKGEGPEEEVPLVFNLKGDSHEILLVKFLTELLYLFESEHKLPHRVEIQKLYESEVEATIWTDVLDPKYHQVKTEIKAVTYHQLAIKKTDKGYEAQVIFDV